MTELELYKYITDNEIEWHRRDNNGKLDVIIFPSISDIDEFVELARGCVDDEGIECSLKDGYLAIWMQDICDYYGIDIDKVFCGEEN